MAKRSRYDELHDYYHNIATSKAGNRYERLAALVFKALEARNTIIHDLLLSGEDSEVKHQIDITIEVPGRHRHRLLIECKDYDFSGKPVRLSTVRDFRSVIEDTNADQGIILTCHGFTKPAQKYARSKGIKLGILRTFEDADMEGRIENIIVNIVIQTKIVERSELVFDEKGLAMFQQNLSLAGVGIDGIRNVDPIYFVKDAQMEQFCFFPF